MSDASSLSPGLGREAAAAPRRPHPSRPTPVSLDEIGAAMAHFPGAVLTIYRSVAECEGEWREAVERCSCFGFQCFEWQAAFQATIGMAEGISPVLAHVADRDGNTLLFLPLGVQRQGRLRVLGFLGGVVTDYGAPIVNPDLAEKTTATEIDQLLAAIVKRVPGVDLVWLKRMPETIEGVRNPLAMLPVAVRSENAYARHLPETLEGLRPSSTNRRKRKQLARQGAVAFCSPPIGSEAAASIMSVLRVQKSRRWRETLCRDLFDTPAYVDFYDRLSKEAWREGAVHLCALSAGDTIVAAHWGIEFRGRFYFLLIGREDGDYDRYSPGRLLIEDLISWCVARGGIRIFDLTAGDEGYKREWMDHTLPLYEYLVPASLKGAAFMAQRRLRGWLKQNRRLRNLVRRWNGLPPA